jgi:polar amino acid transport system substrate-binding protein
LLAVSLPALAQEPPAPGESPRVDAIRKAGALRVGVLANAPWLVENTTGSGEHWSGPAWILAKEYAERLGVKLQPILVSHETKVPVLAANQVDISITPLAETAERKAVVDFILYSNTSVCMFGKVDNPKFAKAKSVDDLNSASRRLSSSGSLTPEQRRLLKTSWPVVPMPRLSIASLTCR